MIDNNRATGRTFRLLTEAINKASSGTNVVVISDSEFTANDFRNRVFAMVNAYNPKVAEKVGDNILQFPNDVCIGFAATGYNTRMVIRDINTRTQKGILTLTDHGLI